MSIQDLFVTILFTVSTAALLYPGFSRLSSFFILRLSGTMSNRKLEKHLPELLDRISSDVSAGHSLQQALESVSKEKTHPFSPLLLKVFLLVESNRSLPEALELTIHDTDSTPLRLAFASMSTAYRSGSNIVQALKILARVCRDREKVRRKIMAQSAQGRMQGIVLCLIPVVFMVALAIVSPHSLHIVLAARSGKIILFAALVIHSTGGIIIARMIRREINL